MKVSPRTAHPGRSACGRPRLDEQGRSYPSETLGGPLHTKSLAVITLPAFLSGAVFLAARGDSGSASPAHAKPSPPASSAGTSADESSLNPRELLGKRLFEDTALSEPKGQACASCHDSRQAFTGNHGAGVAAVARGSRPDTFGNRNVPSAMYASFSPSFGFVGETTDAGAIEYTPLGGQFWDGRASSLADQAKGPFLNPREMNNADAQSVVTKVRAASYAPLFRAVYGDGALDEPNAAYGHIAEAIAAFEATPRFHPFSSKFDDYLRGSAQLNAIEARGFSLFQDPEKGNCISCHVGIQGSRSPQDWLFTDFSYDNLGLPRNTQISDNDDPSAFDLGLCKQAGLASHVPSGVEVGSLCGAFKVPTLRNVELTAPYGHNGYFTDLRDVVTFYATRDTNPELWYPIGPGGAVQRFNDLPARYRANVNTTEVPYDRHPGQQPRLNDEEIEAVVAFLMTLTDR